MAPKDMRAIRPGMRFGVINSTAIATVKSVHSVKGHKNVLYTFDHDWENVAAKDVIHSKELSGFESITYPLVNAE